MSSLAHLILAASRKRKEREGSDGFKQPPTPTSKLRIEPLKPASEPSPLGPVQPSALPAKNRLLAGYLAFEFLAKGTLLGKPFDPPATAESALSGPVKPNEAYADVAYLMKFDGAHIPGVVNPTQLGRWIQDGGLGP